MRNRFNRCCCDGEPPPPPVGSCRICDQDCTYRALGGNVYILHDRHPDEGTEGFRAKGRWSGWYQLLNRSSRIRFIFNHHQVTNGYDYVELQPRDNGQVRILLVREGQVIDSSTQVFQGGLFSPNQFCLHFDETGYVTLLLYSTVLQGGVPAVLTHAFFSSALNPGLGGGVGYYTNDDSVVNSVSFYRAESESVGEEQCVGCSGEVCEPCCTEGPAPAWLLQWPGNLTDVDWTGCDEVELAAGNYVLDARNTLHTLGQACTWSYSNAAGGKYLIQPVAVQGCDDYSDWGFGVPAWSYFILTIKHINGRCRLTVELWIEHQRRDTLCCAGCRMASWSVDGDFEEMCRGSHTLTLATSNSLCGNYPGTLQLIAL